jgi:hypothetical protein
MNNSKIFDWSKVHTDAVPELLRQGELCLEGLLTAAIASDQRATALCGILGAVGGVLLAAAATILAGANPGMALVYSAGATAVPLLIASFLAGFAGRPIDFYMTGYEPHLLGQGAVDKMWMLRYAIVDVQKRIDANREKLVRGSRLISIAFAFAALSILSGTTTFAALRFPCLRHLSETACSAAEPAAVREKAAEEGAANPALEPPTIRNSEETNKKLLPKQ